VHKGSKDLSLHNLKIQISFARRNANNGVYGFGINIFLRQNSEKITAHKFLLKNLERTKNFTGSVEV
jgi:hypothetical protein